MSKSYNKVLRDFENAIMQMQKDLEYLAENKKLSTKFFDKQNHILKSLIDYYERSQIITEELEKESLEYQKAMRNKLQDYENRIISFEAICIIHGIMDFPFWLSKGKSLLIMEAEELGKRQLMHLPLLFHNKLKKLPSKEREIIMNILQREVNTAIKRLLQSINKRK